ncbi:MAG: trypsin-like serine protease, partial [Myxococcota bacterium]
MRNTKVSMLICTIGTFLLMIGCHSSLEEGGPKEELATAHSPITGGWVTKKYSAVGKLNSGGSLCSATLIGTRTVLTAAHCIRKNKKTTFEIKRKKYTAKSVH